ncbi:hypothetical protein C1280_04740 [Gemmata obscuriglobus]|uniref:Uncharacterized protein n=1 Tax=Gemmata obscuriglobus TaxID=114 RepID=A0A2Z3H449_9BACT|nr:hypothetical protein C1280_04740 [Gemmata obscuriglobus]
MRSPPFPIHENNKGRSFLFAPILALLVVGILFGATFARVVVQLADDYGSDFALLLEFPRHGRSKIAYTTFLT